MADTRVYLGIGLKTKEVAGNAGSEPEQRLQRDQRVETNCFSKQPTSINKSENSINKSEKQRVDRVEGRRLTEEEVPQVQRLISKGMSPADARAQVLGRSQA